MCVCVCSKLLFINASFAFKKVCLILKGWWACVYKCVRERNLEGYIDGHLLPTVCMLEDVHTDSFIHVFGCVTKE